MDTMGYLRKIGQFGKNPDGSYTRRIFSPEWERAADLVQRDEGPFHEDGPRCRWK